MGRPRIGIALGSGSARGWAHIGVLRALQEAGIEPDLVCGTSIGAFVGAAYAAGDLDQLEAWARGLGRREVLGFFDVSLAGGLIKGEKLLAFAAQSFLDGQIEGLERPFACVATDLASGREIWCREGSVAEAVRASIALPGLFAPQLREGRHLVDGGLVNPVPVSLCRAMEADIVIAVDLGTDVVGQRFRRAEAVAEGEGWRRRIGRWLGKAGAGGGDEPAFRPSVADVLANSIAIMQGRIARSRLAGEPADVLIAPRLGTLGVLDYHRAAEAIAVGRKAGEHMLPLLRACLE